MKKLKNLSAHLMTWAVISLTALTAQVPNNWYNLDFKTDSILGVSTDPAYELLKGRTSKKVIVAVLDGGTDTAHEDLKEVLWINNDEIAGNGLDDDNNGYADDVYGWNFIGGDEGNVKEDNLEITRLYRKLSPRYFDADPKEVEDKEEYKLYLRVKEDFEQRRQEAMGNLMFYKSILASIEKIEKQVNKKTITAKDLEQVVPEGPLDSLALMSMLTYTRSGQRVETIKDQLTPSIEHFEGQVQHHLNVDFDPRSIVGDVYLNSEQKDYGNTDVMAYGADHGTHVAGIIGAIRNNSIGISGVADNVEIMIVRVVPDGDERDKDVANAIRYATDNGAKVINMSFGKDYSWDKKVVDEAVKYAESKDVLIVHAAGNSAKDLDKEDNFPNKRYLIGGEAKNWIEVGASTYFYDATLPAEFSNYGRKNVDIFAPGYQINSTIPGSQYAKFSGTSMASPVVAGVAALLRSYFPELTAPEIREILMKSSVPVKHKVTVPGTEKTKKFKKLSKSGGVVNAHRAVELAIKKAD